MEREQIIKALECCTNGTVCDQCELRGEKDCIDITLANALSLIKELTEENERLHEKEELVTDNLGLPCVAIDSFEVDQIAKEMVEEG